MKIKFVLASFCAASFIATAQAATPQIATVDTQKVITLSIIGKAAKNNVENEMKKGQGRLAQLKAEFEKSNEELSKQSAVLSGSALEDRKEALGKKRTEYERAAVDLRDGIMRKNDSEIGRVVKEVQATVDEIAKAKGYAFVFERDRQTVVYSSDDIDITSDVVAALDKRKVAL